MFLFTLFSYWRLRNWEVKPVEEELTEPAFPGGELVPQIPGTDAADVTYEPRFAWLPVVA